MGGCKITRGYLAQGETSVKRSTCFLDSGEGRKMKDDVQSLIRAAHNVGRLAGIKETGGHVAPRVEMLYAAERDRRRQQLRDKLAGHGHTWPTRMAILQAQRDQLLGIAREFMRYLDDPNHGVFLMLWEDCHIGQFEDVELEFDETMALIRNTDDPAGGYGDPEEVAIYRRITNLLAGMGESIYPELSS
jgi:hypothetical protein